MTSKKNRGYLDGLMAATIAVAEITGKQPVDGMSDREWELIGKISLKLIEMTKDAATEYAQ
jgi:hypothetical protein